MLSVHVWHSEGARNEKYWFGLYRGCATSTWPKLQYPTKHPCMHKHNFRSFHPLVAILWHTLSKTLDFAPPLFPSPEGGLRIIRKTESEENNGILKNHFKHFIRDPKGITYKGYFSKSKLMQKWYCLMLHPILETSETVYWDRLGLKSLNFKKSHDTAQIKNKKFSVQSFRSLTSHSNEK